MTEVELELHRIVSYRRTQRRGSFGSFKRMKQMLQELEKQFQKTQADVNKISKSLVQIEVWTLILLMLSSRHLLLSFFTSL